MVFEYFEPLKSMVSALEIPNFKMTKNKYFLIKNTQWSQSAKLREKFTFQLSEKLHKNKKLTLKILQQNASNP